MKNVFRANFDPSKSLDSIMTIKVNTPESTVPCYKMQLSVELLKKRKAACSEYNKDHLNSR